MWVESSLFAFLAKTLIYPLDHRLLSSLKILGVTHTSVRA